MERQPTDLEKSKSMWAENTPLLKDPEINIPAQAFSVVNLTSFTQGHTKEIIKSLTESLSKIVSQAVFPNLFYSTDPLAYLDAKLWKFLYLTLNSYMPKYWKL